MNELEGVTRRYKNNITIVIDLTISHHFELIGLV